MTQTCQVTLQTENSTLTTEIESGALVTEAAAQAGIDINQPCGGQGRCGRCVVQVINGDINRRSSMRLTPEDISAGYVLACQTTIESDVLVKLPKQTKLERKLATDKTVIATPPPPDYDSKISQTTQRFTLTMTPPSMDDQTDDWSRLQTAIRAQANISSLSISLDVLKELGESLRANEWRVSAVVDTGDWYDDGRAARLIKLLPGHVDADAPLWGAAIDIGTTTVSVWLVNLINGEIAAQLSEYNAQIGRGEDVISRIIFSSKGNGQEEMQRLVLSSINELISAACSQADTDPDKIVKVAISGNPTMIHLLLGLPSQSIRLSPFVTAVNKIPPLRAREIGLNINPEGTVDCLPGVASYVGADITAGVLASQMEKSDLISLFIDVGTNGEIVLGNQEWLVTCACSAGPAFEGAGVSDGMRATSGAIEEIWITGSNTDNPFEPSYRVIENIKPKGICGSGLISLIAEMFLNGVLDKAGNINLTLDTPRVRKGKHGAEYVVAWAHETDHGNDIVITNVDIDNLKRAKAAIYAGFLVLAESVGLTLEMVDQFLIGGSFGQYINIEKAIQIGLLPDLDWDKFQYLGNTSIKGAYYALLDRNQRQEIEETAGRMTYIELSSDNTFYEAFMSAMFFPHTDMEKFPSVSQVVSKHAGQP
jgi:uncharacterized 2Fe-2S/4Fe-4S cluster protein (DUF4445 family)